MGFNKRFVDKKVVERCLNEGSTLKQLFKADAFIFMDEVGSTVYKWYEKGLSDEEIKEKLKEFEDKTESNVETNINSH